MVHGVAPGVTPGGQGKWAERMMDGGLNEEGVIERLLSKSELTSQIGLTDEQIAALKKTVEEMRKRHQEQRVEKEKAGLEQARLLLETNVNEEAVMAAVEKAGKAETEISKLKVKQLLTLRTALTPEQREKLKDLMRQRVRKMQEEREKGMRGMRGPDMKERRGKNREQGKERTGEAGDMNKPPMQPPPPRDDD
jgi:Spy/CpxP family protein refolding chaperone